MTQAGLVDLLWYFGKGVWVQLYDFTVTAPKSIISIILSLPCLVIVFLQESSFENSPCIFHVLFYGKNEDNHSTAVFFQRCPE